MCSQGMATNVPLTQRQREIIDFIRSCQRRDGVIPSRREIQARFGFASPNAVTKHIEALERKGVLSSGNGRARSIVFHFKDRHSDEMLPPSFSEIPVYGTIPAGNPVLGEQESDACLRVELESLGLPRGPRIFALKVRGNSMTGAGILDGDIVILELKPPYSGQIVAALIDGESTLKTYIVRNRRPFLRAENPQYPDLIPAHELVIQGVMIGLLRLPNL